MEEFRYEGQSSSNLFLLRLRLLLLEQMIWQRRNGWHSCGICLLSTCVYLAHLSKTIKQRPKVLRDSSQILNLLKSKPYNFWKLMTLTIHWPLPNQMKRAGIHFLIKHLCCRFSYIYFIIKIAKSTFQHLFLKTRKSSAKGCFFLSTAVHVGPE